MKDYTDTTRADVGEFFQTLRVESGQTQTDLGHISSIAQHSISSIEGGTNMPNVNTASKLLDALGWDLIARKRGTRGGVLLVPNRIGIKR